MSRYYDPVVHRFINADGYFQSGGDILDVNMSAYCGNNPVNCYDPTGTMTWKQMQENLARGKSCEYNITNVTNAQLAGYGPNDELPEVYYSKRGRGRGENNKPRTDKRHGYEERQKTGKRERNVGHPDGEEHSRVPKGNGIKRINVAPFDENVSATVVFAVATVVTVVLIVDDGFVIGAIDDFALVASLCVMWDSAGKVFE